MTSLLAERELTPEERAVHDEAPRPGLWAGDPAADLRALTQDQTDALIRLELAIGAPDDEAAEVRHLLRGPFGLSSQEMPGTNHFAIRQRGGIDSDPLVRLLAFRAWGDRDRRWFALRGVRSGERVGEHGHTRDAAAMPLVALPWPGDAVLGRALHDARPGEVVEVDRTQLGGRQRCRVSDRLRAEPSRSR